MSSDFLTFTLILIHSFPPPIPSILFCSLLQSKNKCADWEMFSCLAANVYHLACLWKSHLSQKALCKWFHMSLLRLRRAWFNFRSRSEKHQKLKVSKMIWQEYSSMRQKLVFSVGVVALMWFHKHTRDESGFWSPLKMWIFGSQQKMFYIAQARMLPRPHAIIPYTIFPSLLLLFLPLPYFRSYFLNGCTL